MFTRWMSGAFAVALLSPGLAVADSIDPESYADTLDEGESVTIRKTVTIDEGTTSSLIDVIFLIDTSGSMGGEIAAAKTAASDILSGLAGFGNVATGTGYYSDPGYDGLYRSLTTDPTTGQQNINDIDLLLGGGGGDFPEKGFAATEEAAEGAAWRPGSNRFIIALGDANFKESDGSTVDTTLAALGENNVTFIGLDFGSMATSIGFGIDPTVLADATDGGIAPASTDPTTIVDAIIESITAAFAEYSEVTVDDLGNGLPGIDVSTVCVSADTGTCSGATATGEFDRSSARTFEFDVTFTALAEGTYSFDTYALVDGGIVATEADRFTVGEGVDVPEPTTALLIGSGLLGIGLSRRRRRAA